MKLNAFVMSFLDVDSEGHLCTPIDDGEWKNVYKSGGKEPKPPKKKQNAFMKWLFGNGSKKI